MSREAGAVALGLLRSKPSMDDPTTEICRRRGPMRGLIQGQVSSFRDAFVYDMKYGFYVWTVLVCDELCMDLDCMNLMCGLRYMRSYHAHF